jgi:hypothetical protein
MAVDLKKPPAHARSSQVAEALSRAIFVAQGPTITFATATYTSTGAVIVPLFNIGPGMTVVDVLANKTTAFTGTGNAFSIGDSDDTDRFLTAAVFLSTDAGVSRGNANLGFQYADSDPGTIDMSVLVSTGTTGGVVETFLYYTMDMVSS